MAAWLLLGMMLSAGQTLTLPLPAPSEAQLGASPYDLRPLPHMVASAGILLAIGLANGWATPSLGGTANCPTVLIAGQAVCDAQKLRWPDSAVLGARSPPWQIISDVGMYLGMAVPLGGALWESWPHPHPWQQAAKDIAVALESVTAATFVSSTLKFAVRRPRPHSYQPGAQSAAGQLSFPSGHTTSAVAGLAAFGSSFVLRHPASVWRYPVVSGLVVVGGLTAYGRVASGWHFYSDVLAGAVLGGVMGACVPLLYKRSDFAMTVLPTPSGNTMAVRLRF